MTGRPMVLVSCSVLHAPREMGPVIFELLDRGCDVTVLIGAWGIKAEIAAWKERGARILHAPGDLKYGSPPKPASTAPAAAGSAPSQRPRRRFRPSLPVSLKPLGGLAHQLLIHRRVKAAARRLLDDATPAVVLMNNFQSCGKLDNAVMAEAKARGVPVCSILTSPLVSKAIQRPARISNWQTGMVSDAYLASRDWFSRLVARLWPDWTVATPDRGPLFAFLPEDMVAGRVTGLMPRDPWQTPHPDSDVVFAPSERARELLETGGVPSSRIAVCGPPRLDPVVRAVADSAFRDQLGLPVAGPYVLWNIEPSLEHHYCDAETHWARIRFLAARLQHCGLPTVVSLHPLCRRDDYRFLETGHGLHVARAGIEYLYPGCAFAVSFGCSTNVYAMVFGKRMLMYDWFGIRRDPRRWALYSQPGMAVVESLEDFALRLDDFVAGRDLPAMANADGLPRPAAPRIVDHLLSLVSRP